MDVGAEPDVVGKVPASMIGVVVDDDIIAIPVPVIRVRLIKRRDAEVESAKPETARSPTDQTPAMTRAEASFEVAMFPGMVDVEPGFLMPEVVSDPLAIPMDVRGFRMAFVVAEGFPVIALMRVIVWSAVIGGRTITRNVPSTEVMTSMILVLAMLRPQGEGEHE